jgi:hypothetical protein
MIVSRRGILRSLFATPALIAIDRLMPVRALRFKDWPPPAINGVSMEDARLVIRQAFMTVYYSNPDVMPIEYSGFIPLQVCHNEGKIEVKEVAILSEFGR